MTTLQKPARATLIDLTAEVDIAVPAETVWAAIADYRSDVQWRRGVRRMEPTPAGPVMVGTTTDEEMRLGGATYRNLGVVTAVEPGRSFAWRTTDGAEANGSRTVDALGPESSRLHLTLTVRVTGSQRLIAPLLKMMLRRNVNGDIRRLRAQLQSAPTG